MQLPSPQHYLMKTRSNIAYYFYLSKDRSLSIKTFSEKNEFLEDEVLVTQSVVDYSVTIDPNDYIHLICITSDSILSYYLHQNNKWNYRQISKVDIKSNVYRNLVLFIKNKDIHILCNKTNYTNPAITSIEHMYWNDKNMKKVTVTTYLPGKYSSPFQVDIDNVGNLHLVYKVLHQKNNQLYYSFFSAFNKKWSNSEIISNLQEDHSHPHILMDNQDNLHLVWCTIEDNNFTLKYKRRIHASKLKAKWSTQKNLSDKNTNNHSPLLLQEGYILKVLSRQNDRFNEIISMDFGDSWENGSESLPNNAKDLIPINYNTNNDLEKINTNISKVYGEIDQHISTVGVNLFPIPLNKLEMSEGCEVFKVEVPDNQHEEENIIKKTEHETENIFEETPINSINDRPEDGIKQEITDQYPKGLNLDENLKILVQEVQNYINKMVFEIEKLEETEKLLQQKNSPLEDLDSSQTFVYIQNNLSELNHQLDSIEAEEFELQKELDHFQKKIYVIEDRMIQFKKQLLELEDKVMKIPSLQSSLVNRLKSIFR